MEKGREAEQRECVNGMARALGCDEGRACVRVMWERGLQEESQKKRPDAQLAQTCRKVAKVGH